jgi:hypothetical protein
MENPFVKPSIARVDKGWLLAGPCWTMAPVTIEALFGNPIFLSALFSLLIAQFLKSMIGLLRSRKPELKETMVTFLWKTGGMPSSHSATAVSISAAIALTEGFSNLFILSLFLSLIVIRDALGVRRSSGLQAKALNRLGNETALRLGLKYESVKEVHGHSWLEVLVGAILGYIIAFAFCRL